MGCLRTENKNESNMSAIPTFERTWNVWWDLGWELKDEITTVTKSLIFIFNSDSDIDGR